MHFREQNRTPTRIINRYTLPEVGFKVRVVLIIAGIMSIVWALLQMPLGVGRYAALVQHLRSNYQVLVDRGIAKDDLSVTPVLARGIERTTSTWGRDTALPLLVAGTVQLCAAYRFGKSCSVRHTRKDDSQEARRAPGGSDQAAC